MMKSIYKLLFVLALLAGGTSAWAQTILSQGTVSSQSDVSAYYHMLDKCPQDITSQLGGLNTWTQQNITTRSGQHWDGSDGSSYYENNSGWGASSWPTTTMTKTISLSAGKYVIAVPARSSANANAYIKVGGTTQYIANGGDTGLGVNTSGIPSFSGSDTYANSNNGRGWRYTYIQFQLDATQNVTFEFGGSASTNQQWMSFTNPQLIKLEQSSGLFHEWSDESANASVTVTDPSNFVWKVGSEVTSGQVIYGNNNGAVPSNQYADLSGWDQLVITFDNTKAVPRFLFNKASDGTTITVESAGDYMTIDGNTITIHLAKLASDNGGYAHLNCIKAPWGGSGVITSAQLENVPKPVTISKTIAVGSDNMIQLDGNLLCDHIPYNYIRIELVKEDNSSRYLTPIGDGIDLSQTDVQYASFRVESQYGDQQNTYTRLEGDKFATASLGQWYDGIIVSSGTFTFKIPNDTRSGYRGNHIRFYLARYKDGSYGVNNPPEIEKTYDYTLWIAGNEAGATEHKVYDTNTGASSFVVNLYNLTNNGADIRTHFGKSNFTDFDNFYLRWYVADKVTHEPIADENGNPISLKTPAHVLDPTTTYTTQLFYEDIGMLWYLRQGWIYGSTPSAEMGSHAEEVLKVQVNLPNGLTQNDVELVALVSDDYTNSDVGAEPWNLKHKYVVSFVAGGEVDYQNLPFRHYKGVTGRDWVTPTGSTGSMTQSVWTAADGYNKLLPTTVSNDPTAGSASEQTVDVRQGVHTWEYDVYITPGDGQRALILPFENYMYGYQTGISADGNDLEPRAYFRWYDWKTDKAVAASSNYTFEACNSDILKPYWETVSGDTRNRGLVALNLDPTFPTQGRVGVWLTVNDGFNETNYPNGIDIACDVSKYSDGIVVFGTNAYLVHEPTLSMRYIFHIYPGKKIADELAAAKTNLSKARQVLENTSGEAEKLRIYTTLEYLSYTDAGLGEIKPMFDLPENIGRVTVSLGAGKSGNFSLRLDGNSLDNYKLWDGGNLVSADGVRWVAFYEDEKNGDVLRKNLDLEPGTNRIRSFSYSDFTGNFYPLGSSTPTTINDGMKFHVIGYVTSGSGVNTLTGTGIYAPVVHYELQFMVAPPLSVNEQKNNASVRIANIKRTDEYMKDHYDLQSVVDFDGNPETNENLTLYPDGKHYFYSSLNGSGALDGGKTWDAAPTARENNMSWMPREWTDIEYSYCYPQLTDYVIDSRGGYWCYNHFLSPFHGDYMILESMNVSGISESRQTPYELQWWWGSVLHDYTHVTTSGTKSGSFLYTDASNESRTMVTIPFNAELCAGSTIYFTAAVADMTNAQTKPQLLIRILGVDEHGNRSRVVSFHTCDISTTGATTGEWYQVYGESTIPINFDDEIESFICEVVNYADNTNGADFAIDQFQIYTNTAKVKLTQESGECGVATANRTFIYADAEGIQALYGKTGTTKIYWRIHDEHGEVVTGAGMYSNADDGTSIYGEIEIPLDYVNHLKDGGGGVVVDEAAVKANENLHWYMGDDGKVYLKIAYRYLPDMLDGQTYYVSLYHPRFQNDPLIGFKPENNSYWGGLHTAARDKCSIFSQLFIPGKQYVIYYDNVHGITEGGQIKVACGAAPEVSGVTMRLKKPDLEEPSGFSNVDGLHYDYVFCTIAQWGSSEKFDATYTYQDLRGAIEHYRATYYTNYDVATIDGSYTAVPYRSILQAALDAKVLKLACSTTFSNNFNDYPSKDFTVVCLPVETTIPGTTEQICTPFVVKFDIVWPSPDLHLGFADVEYPNREELRRVIRIGLEQLNNLRNNGYKLHIPIHDYNDKDKKANSGLIRFNGDYLTLSSVSNDPTASGYTVGVTRFAKLETPESGMDGDGGDNPFVDAEHMFLALDLSGDNCQINFHEGYTYEVSTQIFDKADNQSTPCCSDIYLVIKVVPEYITWDPQQIDATYYNVNWNNDENWNRSERAELYMDDAATHQQNTPTTWRSSVTEGGTYYFGDKYYKNATEINASLSSGQAFVPMKFTYVTLPEACRAPSLINMELVAYNTSPYTGGAILAGNLITDPSPVDPSRTVNSPATPDILYDMLVRYSETECQGHLKSDKTIYGQGTANVYDCEKFYGNICKEIYFKPQAELINQQRLTYEKAWVEKELVPNQWYLLSSPLKATYAGDMYVPVTMTDLSLTTPATVKGRQVTEAFQPITFNTSAGYSRTQYPFYQHSWDHGTGANGSVVYTETTDPRQPRYSADLKFTGAVTSTFAQWSHVFNDVQVRYDQMQGFAIRAHKQNQANNALIRLPKADTSWKYYDYADTEGATQSVTKGNLNYGRFITEDNEGKPINNRAEMTIALVQPNTNTDNQYFLVGNPYMASLDMSKFLAANTHLVNAWWTISGDPATGQTTGRVRPMEAFFVKTDSPGTPVNFNKDMMVDGNDGATPAPARPYMFMKASAGGATSTARLELSDNAIDDYLEGEDVETLFDSNLSDVPMVYTVAGGQAVSIDVRPEMSVVPFGVVCTDTEEPVTVTLEGTGITDSQLYVLDAMTGKQTAIEEGVAFTIVPNDYGRYFLTSSSLQENMAKDQHDGLIIRVRNGVVTVTAHDELGTVRAVRLSGQTAYSQTGCGQRAEFSLQPGVYIIEANGATANRNMKIIVK